MEKKFYVGLSILLLLLFFCVFVGICVGHCQASIGETVAASVTAAESGDLQAGYQLMLRAKEDWERCWKGIASIAHHATMEQIDQLFSRLCVCTQPETRWEFLTCSAQLQSLLDALANDHTFTWWNLL